MRKQLSTTVYTFSNIIEGNGLFVDKTDLFYKLVQGLNNQFFLSRPRRFGKSLTLSALKSIFQGKKELFKGLDIYDRLEAWDSYPIIHLAMNRLQNKNASVFETHLCCLLDDMAEDEGFSLARDGASAKLDLLIRQLRKKYTAKVVLLIDEYDKPILDNILDAEVCADIRSCLKSFYGQIKANEEHIRFTFITGVSKFTHTSIFSDLNNLTDITMDRKYAGICGFTQEECEHYFAEWIDENHQELDMSRDAYLAKLKVMYNGIRFTEKPLLVYNPVSFTKAMDNCDFKNYWFETGTPTFLLDLLRNKDVYLPDLESYTASAKDFSSYDIEHLSYRALMYQTGYVTIKDYDQESEVYTLGYPNREVRKSFIEHLTDCYADTHDTTSFIESIRTAFLADDLETVFERINQFFVGIEYDIKLKHEKYYQSIFYCIFSLLGYRINTEIKTNKGRMDALIQTKAHIYIIEFKLDISAAAALAQIKSKDYAQKYHDDERIIVLIGANFSSSNGELEGWEHETLTQGDSNA